MEDGLLHVHGQWIRVPLELYFCGDAKNMSKTVGVPTRGKDTSVLLLSTMSSSATNSKRHITADEFQRLSEDLAFLVAKDKFRPTFVVSLWRGGSVPGLVVQEFLEVAQDSVIDHIAIRTSSRDPLTGKALEEIKIHAVNYVLGKLTAEDCLLIVDDVWDSGRSGKALVKHLQDNLGERMPRDTRFATVFYKPARNKFLPYKPEYYVVETDEWLVFPHELTGLRLNEIEQHRPHAAELLASLHDS